MANTITVWPISWATLHKRYHAYARKRTRLMRQYDCPRPADVQQTINQLKESMLQFRRDDEQRKYWAYALIRVVHKRVNSRLSRQVDRWFTGGVSLRTWLIDKQTRAHVHDVWQNRFGSKFAAMFAVKQEIYDSINEPLHVEVLEHSLETEG